MKLGSSKINLKIFLIDKTYYEFKELKSTQEKIELIKNNHLKKLRAKHDLDELTSLNETLTHSVEKDFEFWSYSYNQPKNQYYWKLFLPNNLTDKHNFEVIEFSYVLFIKYKSEIYCVIGGSGMSVIKKFIDPNFGIDLYQHFAKPTEDVLIELNSRGIASNISQKRHTFNLNQTISETLEYSDIPTKIKIILREEVKKTLFKKYDLGSDKSLLEIGAYFYLRKSLNFKELMELIKDIHSIKTNGNYTELTLFKNIKNENLITELDKILQNKIIDDIISHSSVNRKNIQQDVLEIVHPTKLERFYECDNFIIKKKYSRGKSDIEIKNRSDLYFECTKYINENTEKLNERFEIGKKLYTTSIIGRIKEKEITYATFYSHITAEIDYLDKKYFRIDAHWYYLQDKFVELMNIDAIDFYNKYHLDEKILNKWEPKKNEDYYNLSHSGKGYYVLDKVIKENIELCDILIVKDDKAYFVHVKNGFNTKMRELYIQVILSAKRLSNDLKNNKGSKYLKNTLDYYNERKPKNKIDTKDFIDRINKKEIQIIFVMAFKNNYYKDKKTIEKIELSKSNIAKYSMVRTVKEMQQQNNFGIRLIDISEL